MDFKSSPVWCHSFEGRNPLLLKHYGILNNLYRQFWDIAQLINCMFAASHLMAEIKDIDIAQLINCMFVYLFNLMLIY
ncbi:MAG: hypothetical protein EVG15_04820 [Candidatus Acididesulfobacter diazotrophicus]|uniref:Uncharacterized protein n=1 Tax=Candidatus Acididesulfobacter diazotrophicus TaxID=2597226 RepID=A0A519BN54_9DELT|nr:MAG: hypothetical protein EVG15_04820 [Candidatus Acididesulfobacter diazotrophicus]